MMLTLSQGFHHKNNRPPLIKVLRRKTLLRFKYVNFGQMDKIHSVQTDVHFLSDSKTNVGLRKKTSPAMMPLPWKGSFITSPAPSDRLQFWWHMCDSPPSFNQNTHPPLCLQIPCCQEGRLAGVCVFMVWKSLGVFYDLMRVLWRGKEPSVNCQVWGH